MPFHENVEKDLILNIITVSNIAHGGGKSGAAPLLIGADQISAAHAPARYSYGNRESSN